EILFEVQVKGQRTRELEREPRFLLLREVLLSSREGKNFAMQPHGVSHFFSRGFFRFIGKEQNVSLQECALPVDFQHFNSLAALGNNLQTAVLVLFCHCDNSRSTPDFGYTFILCPDTARLTIMQKNKSSTWNLP